jgi:hypothetical protein
MAKNYVASRKVTSAKHGIETDKHGFPSESSLQAWHRKNNPHLFEEEPARESTRIPWWLLLPFGVLLAFLARMIFSANETPKSDFDPHDLYRNAGDGVYVPYPIKPAIYAKLPKGKAVRKAVRRSSLWKTWAAALALVLRVSALTLLMYVVFLLVR